MRIATVLIRKKSTGRKCRINEYEWARDLGKGRWSGWERVGQETQGDEGADAEQKVHSPEGYRQDPLHINSPKPKPEPEPEPEPPPKAATKETPKARTKPTAKKADLTFGEAIKEIDN